MPRSAKDVHLTVVVELSRSTRATFVQIVLTEGQGTQLLMTNRVLLPLEQTTYSPKGGRAAKSIPTQNRTYLDNLQPVKGCVPCPSLVVVHAQVCTRGRRIDPRRGQ